MSLILCPECGTKISDKAITCPYCGFMSENHSLPISVQDTYEVVPTFSYDVEEWNPDNGELNVIAVRDNRLLVEQLGSWQNIQLRMPAIAKVIESMAKKEKILVTNMDSYVKELIDKGIYRFSIDKQGEILPTIRDAEGIVKQVRLTEMEFTPELASSLNNLSQQAAMAQILDEIEYVGDAIRGIHVELQNDRLALAESTRDKFLLATKMQDTRLREIAIMGAVESATEAKRILMRNFMENLSYIEEHSQLSELQLFMEGKKGKDIPQKAADAFQALVSITNTVQIECEGLAIMGEYEASKASLLQFKQFITDNKLDQKDTLLLLNGNTPLNKVAIVDEFMLISERITKFEETGRIASREVLKITEAVKDERKEESE